MASVLAHAAVTQMDLTLVEKLTDLENHTQAAIEMIIHQIRATDAAFVGIIKTLENYVYLIFTLLVYYPMALRYFGENRLLIQNLFTLLLLGLNWAWVWALSHVWKRPDLDALAARVVELFSSGARMPVNIGG